LIIFTRFWNVFAPFSLVFVLCYIYLTKAAPATTTTTTTYTHTNTRETTTTPFTLFKLIYKEQTGTKSQKIQTSLPSELNKS